MTDAASQKPSAELESFLFAEVGREDNGMTLTVASAFARLGLDPWHQADMLARLSEASATASLASLIGRLQLGPQIQALPAAARLVALLPHGSAAAAPAKSSVRGEASNAGSRTLWLFWGAIAAVAAYVVWF